MLALALLWLTIGALAWYAFGFTVAFNMSEQPAVSINCGYSAAGLPIGLQIIGKRFEDVGVLALARTFEAMRSGEQRPWPEPPAI